MKNFIKLFLLSIIALCVIGCADPVTPPAPVIKCTTCKITEVENEGDMCQSCIDNKKIFLYSQNLGTFKYKDSRTDTSLYVSFIEAGMTEYITFTENSITFYDGIKYPFDPTKDILLPEEVNTDEIYKEYSHIYDDYIYFFKLGDCLYGMCDDRIWGINSITIMLYRNCNFLSTWKFPDNNNDNNSNAESLEGSYNFNNATGSQMNGQITLENGTWSYNGDKYNAAATEGTYTVSGNTITFYWTANGYEVSETITVSTSGTSSTWTSNGYTFFSMLFGVFGQEMTFDYTE